MARYQPYSRREFNRRYRSWFRRNRLRLAAVSVGMVAVLVGLTIWFTWLLDDPSPFFWWFLGFLQASAVGVVVLAVHTAFLAHDRGAIGQMRGAWGEEYTREELRRARRRRLVWRWVDSIDLQIGDLDHLVITRRGGLVAVDSKWRSDLGDRDAMARSARRGRLRAEALARSLLVHERGRHRARVNPLPVTSIVVLWGLAQHDLPPGAEADGIQFVPGRRLVEWLHSLEGEPVGRVEAADLARRLEDFRAHGRSANRARDEKQASPGL